MKRNLVLILTAFFIATLLFSFVIAAQQSKAPAKETPKPTEKETPKEMTITGHVIDPACYMTEGRMGADHKKCAQMCAKAGQTLGILEDKTNKIYISLADEMGTDPNAKIFDLAEEHVKVTGKVIHKGGISGIVISKAEAVPAGK